MFDFVRDHTRLALGFMLLLIIPSFIFFGVQGYSRFTEGSATTVAKVDGQAITRSEWDDAHKRYADQLRRQAPGVDPAQFETPQLRHETLDRIVRDRVLQAAANQLHLFPTVARMSRLFDSDPQYQGLRGPDGKISREFLVGQGLTPELFDQRLRQDLGVRQVLAGITQTVPTPAVAASAALDAFLQRREVQLQRFEAAAYRARVTPGDAEIEAYYKAHSGQFMAPEQARIEYALLDLDALAKSVTLSEADLRKAYEDGASRYTVPEERRASHILIKAEGGAGDKAKARARAEALLAEVRKTPAAFAELARKNSQDPGSAARGGDLDFFGRGDMAKPFDEAVFKLKPGEISDVVETDFGFHIISLTEVRGGTRKSFEEVRAELEGEQRRALALGRWADVAEQFTNTVYEQSNSLQPVIDKLKLEKRTALVQRQPAPGQTGALASARLLDAVFGNEALHNQRNTDAIEVGAHQLVSAHVVEYTPARQLALADVKDKVKAQVVEQQAAALALQEGQARLASLKAGAADPLPLTLVVSRTQAQGLPRPVLDAVLQADPAHLPAVLGLDLPGQGYAVLRVTRVLARELPPGGDEPLRAQYAQAWAAAEADAYVAALKNRYKAEIKPGVDQLAAEAPASAPGR
jgi:peptidyl-prolyl cis-trans isomerase D